MWTRTTEKKSTGTINNKIIKYEKTLTFELVFATNARLLVVVDSGMNLSILPGNTQIRNEDMWCSEKKSYQSTSKVNVQKRQGKLTART